MRRVGWLALVVAGSGWIFLWYRVIRGSIFCGGGPVECPSLLGEAPMYLALVGMVAPAIAIGITLDRAQVGPRFMSVSSIALSSIGLISVLVLTVGTYDLMISMRTGGRLDMEYRPPILPPVLLALGSLWPLFYGGWMTLTSLQLVRLGVPIAIAGIGVPAGFAAVLTLPFSTEWPVYSTVLPLELVASLVWATAVGIFLLSAREERQPLENAGNFRVPRTS